MIHPYPSNFRITSTFLQHKRRKPPSKNPGVDYAMPMLTPIYAHENGHVSCGVDKAGNVWALCRGNVFTFEHVHIQLCKKVGPVKQGETIAFSGNSGNSTGPHTHLTVYLKGKRVDAEPLLNNLYIKNDSMDIKKIAKVFSTDRSDVWKAVDGVPGEVIKWWRNGGVYEYVARLYALERLDVLEHYAWKWKNRDDELLRWYYEIGYGEYNFNTWYPTTGVNNPATEILKNKLKEINKLSKL